MSYTDPYVCPDSGFTDWRVLRNKRDENTVKFEPTLEAQLRIAVWLRDSQGVDLPEHQQRIEQLERRIAERESQ